MNVCYYALVSQAVVGHLSVLGVKKQFQEKNHGFLHSLWHSDGGRSNDMSVMWTR
jgi:hypothetical protein